MNTFEIIFDNGGGATLQVMDGSFAHSYDDMMQLAEDARRLLGGETPELWDGHEPECYVSDEKFNAHVDNGGYKLLDSDDLVSEGLEEKCTRNGWANMIAFFEAYSATN